MTGPLVASDFVEFVRQIYSTNEFIPLHRPIFAGRERDYVVKTLESTFVSTVGEEVEHFEKKIADYTGAKYVVATTNGTSALHTALLCAGVARGDEVITSPLTFVATCNAIHYCGAEPTFIDIDEQTLGLSPDSLTEFFVENTEIRDDLLCWNVKTNKIIRACVPVHNLGHPARIDQIREICDRQHVFLIEDAAESLGSEFKNTHTGRFAKAGVLSFNGNKIITTGGGGALITDDENLAVKAKHKTTTSKLPHPWLYMHDEVGFNYRLPNINAALGCAQIEQLDQFVQSKRALAVTYSSWLKERDIPFIEEPLDARSNYWLNALLLDNRSQRDEFLHYTNDQGVMTRPMWTPMHTLPMYESCHRGKLIVSETIENRLVNVPSSVVSVI